MDIYGWLKSFKECWISYDIEGISKLFVDDAVYFETPFLKLVGRNNIFNEWRSIVKQKNIFLETKIFSSDQNKHSIIWKLKYDNLDGKKCVFGGTYLIELNEDGLCKFFHHCCEVSNKDLKY